MRRVVWDGVSNATLAHHSLAMEGRSSEGDRQRTDCLELSKDRHGVSTKHERRQLKMIDQGSKRGHGCRLVALAR